MGLRGHLSLVLALVYVASQSLTLSHNAEFGPDHRHDHHQHAHQDHDHHGHDRQQHDYSDHHEIDSPVFSTLLKAHLEELDSEPDSELCAFVLHSDRCGVADVPHVQVTLAVEFYDLDYRSTHAGLVSRLQTSHDQARAPPLLA